MVNTVSTDQRESQCADAEHDPGASDNTDPAVLICQNTHDQLTERIHADVSRSHPGDLCAGQSVIDLQIIEYGSRNRCSLKIGCGIKKHHGDKNRESGFPAPYIGKK